MSKLTFTYDDFSPKGIRKYTADLERRARKVGLIGAWDTIEIEDYDFHMEVEAHETHLHGLGYTLVNDRYAVQDVKDVKAAEVRAKKRWWQRG